MPVNVKVLKSYNSNTYSKHVTENVWFHSFPFRGQTTPVLRDIKYMEGGSGRRDMTARQPGKKNRVDNELVKCMRGIRHITV